MLLLTVPVLQLIHRSCEAAPAPKLATTVPPLRRVKSQSCFRCSEGFEGSLRRFRAHSQDSRAIEFAEFGALGMWALGLIRG